MSDLKMVQSSCVRLDVRRLLSVFQHFHQPVVTVLFKPTNKRRKNYLSFILIYA